VTLLLPSTTQRVKALQLTQFKAVGETGDDGKKLGEGEFTALASVFGNIDRYGERVIKGAFSDTLEAWAAKGDPIPVIWYHAWTDPFAHIGEVLSIEEREDGLWYKGAIDLDEPLAAKVYKLMKGRRITQQSFGFDVIDGGFVKADGIEVYDITKVELFEVGPCLQGVNPATELLDVKAFRSVAPIPGTTEHSGPAAPPATPTAPSEEPPASVPTPEGPQTKALDPASVRLMIDALELEGED
jgi:HK97 family phage prohead protease